MTRLTNPNARIVGISLNTSSAAPVEAEALLADLTARHDLPCFDPLRSNLDAVIERILAA